MTEKLDIKETQYILNWILFYGHIYDRDGILKKTFVMDK